LAAKREERPSRPEGGGWGARGGVAAGGLYRRNGENCGGEMRNGGETRRKIGSWPVVLPVVWRREEYGSMKMYEGLNVEEEKYHGSNNESRNSEENAYEEENMKKRKQCVETPENRRKLIPVALMATLWKVLEEA